MEAHVDGVPGMGEGAERVICFGGLPLFLGVEVGDVEQPVEREAPQAGHPFVQGIEGFQPETLKVPTPFPA